LIFIIGTLSSIGQKIQHEKVAENLKPMKAEKKPSKKMASQRITKSAKTTMLFKYCPIEQEAEKLEVSHRRKK